MSVPRVFERRVWQGVVGTVAAAFVAGSPISAGSAQPDGSAPIRVSIAARAERPGELLVLTILTGADEDAVTVRVFNRETHAVHVSGRAWRALVGIDLDQAPGSSELTVEAGSGPRLERMSRTVVVRSRRFPVRKLTVDPDFISPPPEIQERIEREAALVRDVYRHSHPEALWRPPFVRPVPGLANSAFGTRSVFNGRLRSPHAGTDFLSPAGTPIKAPIAGRVVVARPLFLSGNTVIIDHGGGLFSLLAHMSVLKVAEGQSVQSGEIVGLVGATGRATGPHLHWSLRVDGARVDPTSALALLKTED